MNEVIKVIWFISVVEFDWSMLYVEHDDIMDSPNKSISNDPSMPTSTNIWLFPYMQNEVHFAQQLNWESQFINVYIWYACVGTS